MNNLLLIKVEGKNLNKFLLKCNENKIKIINIKYLSYKSIIITINVSDYKKIKKIKSIYKIEIIDSKGLLKYKSIIKEYKVMIISFFLSILLLIFLSNIIFNIEIESNNNVLRNLIIKELSNYGIEKYKFKKSYDEIEIIKNKIKSKYKDKIEWIEIKRIGTKYLVNVVERKIDKIKKEEEIYSIVSKKSGVIRGIDVEKGIALVQKGDYIRKNDVLISSDIIFNEEIKNRVSAKGKVYAECWYKVKVEYPLKYTEKKYTDKKRIIPYIRIGKRYIEILKYDNYDRNNLFNYKDKIGNIEFGIEKIRNIEFINDMYTKNEAKKLAIASARDKLLQKLQKGEYIIDENTLNFYSNGSKIIIEIFFSVYEEIGERKVIEVGEENGTKHNSGST